MNKKYYDGIIIFDILAKHLDAKKMMEVLKAFADVKGVDAVEVIRCKDCMHFDGYYCHNKWWGDGYANYTPPIKREDGFCDWAERNKHEINLK
jgi:hypothetical protein